MAPAFFEKYRVSLLASLVTGLLLAVHFFTPPKGGLWTRTFFDSLHVPVFGLIAVCVYLAQSPASSWQRRGIIAVLVTVVLGLLSETAQIHTARDASLRDLVADSAGALGFLAILFSVFPPEEFSRAVRLLLAGFALLLLGWILMPLTVVGLAYSEQLSQFPVIAQFDSRFGHVLKRAQNVDYRVVPATDGEPSYALVTLQNKPWPGVAFHDLRPDWSSYSSLIVDLGIDGEDHLDIYLRVHDEAHASSKKFSDRFNRSYSLKPGRHEIRISIADIAQAPRDRVMDLKKISELIIFSDAAHAGNSFRIYEIRLE